MSILSGESVRPSRKVVDSSDRAVSPLLSNKSNGSRFVAKLKAMMRSNMPFALLMGLGGALFYGEYDKAPLHCLARTFAKTLPTFVE